FYREMVEHPQFVAKELRKGIEFRRWNDRGRIWRIVPRDGLPADPPRAPRLGKAGTAGLVALLGHDNGWRRDTAPRLLVERRDPPAAALITTDALASKNPMARLHALWTLDGLASLDNPALARALRDPHPGVRESTAELAGRRPALTDALIALDDDPEIRV